MQRERSAATPKQKLHGILERPPDAALLDDIPERGRFPLTDSLNADHAAGIRRLRHQRVVATIRATPE